MRDLRSDDASLRQWEIKDRIRKHLPDKIFGDAFYRMFLVSCLVGLFLLAQYQAAIDVCSPGTCDAVRASYEKTGFLFMAAAAITYVLLMLFNWAKWLVYGRRRVEHYKQLLKPE